MFASRKAGLFALTMLTAMAAPHAAFAYRPFDSTDASVAEPGEVEIELSPVSFLRDESGETWIAPQLRLNYGFARNWEIVVEGQGEHSQGATSALIDNAVFLKHVVREGTLQDEQGLSIAAEAGVLLPGINGDSGMGAEVAGIIGNRWSWGAIHATAAVSLTRDNRGEVFFGTIIEGPGDWAVRPVAELVYQREFGTTEVVAALIGLIWEAKENLAFDLAVRHAGVNGEPETEIRLGLTFAFSRR